MSSAHAVESAIMLSLVKRLTTHRSFLAAAALGILLPSCRSRNGLVGEWVSVTRGRGGVAATVDFRPDASFTSAYETMLDCFYRLEKAQLILSCPDPKTGQNSNELVETRLEGDTLVLKAPWDGTEYQMEISWLAIKSARLRGKTESAGGTRTIVPPAWIVVKISKIDRSK